MLVSTIARFSAINSMNNAAYGMVQNSQNIQNNAFRGDDTNLYSLHQLEKRSILNLLKDSLLYKISSKQLEQKNRSLDYKA